MQLLALLVALLLAPLNIVAPDDGAPVVQNPGMECVDGYYDQPGIPGMVPLGWTARTLRGTPHTGSVQMWLTYTCKAEQNLYEKIEGYDSFVVKAAETPPYQDFDAPPFDLALYQSVKVTPGQDYSLSAWMVSFCGGTATPTSCPGGAYIAKMAALDPTGGTDPTSPALAWLEDRRPHTEAPWTDLILAATAKSDSLTIFLRVNSPFHHRGNYAHIDAVKLVRSPNARVAQPTVSGRKITVSWNGDLGPDVPAIPAGTHRLSFEAQARRGAGAWQPWLKGVGAGSETYTAAGSSCAEETYQFRVRAWAIQPSGQPGSWPFHEFFSVWKESPQVTLPKTMECRYRTFAPGVAR